MILDVLRRRKAGLAIGLSLAMAAGFAQLIGWLEPINNFGFDVRSRMLGGIPAHPRIVLIDIDDSSIKAVGEYPWPRRYFADLVRELDALGADRMILDVLFTEPAPPRLAGAEEALDEDTAMEIIGDTQEDEKILDDAELGSAMRQAVVYLPSVGRVGYGPAPSELQSAGSSPTVEGYFDSTSDPTLTGYLDFAMRPDQRQSMSLLREDLIREFRAEQSRRTVLRNLPLLPDGCADLPRAYDFQLPLPAFVVPARGVGFAAYPREEQGGVVRSVPMAVRMDDAGVYQVGLLATLDAIGIPRESIQCGSDAIHVGSGSLQRTLPHDGRGETLVYWHVPSGKSKEFTESFAHLPAARVLEIPQLRRAIVENVRRLRIRRGELVQARFEAMPEEYAHYARQVRRRGVIEKAMAGADTAPPGLVHEKQSLQGGIEKMEADAVVWLQRTYNEWEKTQPRDASEQEMKDRIARFHGWFASGQLEKDVAQTNHRLHDQIAERTKTLKDRIAGKICLIGYTATAAADLITTPIHPKAPGVMVHANIINMVLQNRFLRAWSPQANAALVAAVALLAALIACAANWRISLLAVLLIWAGMWVAGSIAFGSLDVHIASLPAVAGAAVAWSGVTLYRQGTEERARRRLQLALTQYTSPAIAAAISERVRPDTLLPRTATVTCFFSDLEGFTQLSEKLGPARTRDVLNPYLELASKILIEHGAIVNKFVGDGVFAFFNAPIRPCKDHALGACRAALQLFRQCPTIGSSAGGQGPESIHRVRIGLSTGEAFVGDYGSHAKLDYTCIGDTVNVGSRLEHLNKLLGTSVLIDGPTRRLIGEQFAVRPLGLIRIPGRTACAEVFEITDPPSTPHPASDSFFQYWTTALSCYQACRWDDCTNALAECRRIRPTDLAVGLYARAADRWKQDGPSADWIGALDLDGT